MGIDVALDRAIRRPRDRVALVRAVLAAHPADETEFIEWKRELPLELADGRFEAARQILGFANRTPESAARWCEGHAYLLIGVEPGHLAGAKAVDPAVFESWMAPYLGDDGPVWDLHHVEVDGKVVLLVDVSPPAQGDPIHTLKKEFQQFEAGTVFFRHKGRTIRATPIDIAALTARARATPGRIALAVSWADSQTTVRALDLSDEAVESALDAERRRLLAPLEREERRAKSPSRSIPTIPSSALDAFQAASTMRRMAGWLPDNRTADEFRAELDAYLAELKQWAVPAAVSYAVSRGESRMEIRIENVTDVNFRAVRLQLHIGGRVLAMDPDEITDRELLPTPPRPWGTERPPTDVFGFLSPDFLMPPITQPYVGPVGPSMEIDHGGSVTIRFPPVDLQPRSVELLDTFHLFPAPGHAGEVLEATWTATATSSDGVASGVLAIKVADAPLSVERLLEEGPSPEGDAEQP